MDLRGYEFNQVTGLPVVGATVTVYTGTLTHPPVTAVTSGVTNGDGLWSFTGLTDVPKDVKVEANGQVKWYKGMSRHGTSTIFFEEPIRFKQVASIAAAPGAGASVLGFLTDGEPIFRSGAAGAQTKIATYTGATGVLKSTGWGTIAAADIGTGAVTSAAILDGTIATADLAANSVSLTGQVVGSSGLQTLSTIVTVTDLADMDLTLTTTATADILVWFWGAFFHTVAGSAIEIYITLNGGANTNAFSVTLAAANTPIPFGTHARFPAQAAGANRIKVRWLTNAADAKANGSQRYLMAEAKYR